MKHRILAPLPGDPAYGMTQAGMRLRSRSWRLPTIERRPRWRWLIRQLIRPAGPYFRRRADGDLEYVDGLR